MVPRIHLKFSSLTLILVGPDIWKKDGNVETDVETDKHGKQNVLGG